MKKLAVFPELYLFLMLAACAHGAPVDIHASVDAQLRTNAQSHGIPAQAVLALHNGNTLRDNDLHIRCGLLIKKSIGYSEINAAQKSRNPLAAPALSLRRVRIDHGNGYTLISPKDRELFIEELMKRVRYAT